MSWTTTNEARYRQLQDELHELTKARERSVECVARALNDALGSEIAAQVDVFRVIAHADPLRDALAAYDSGVRPEPPAVLERAAFWPNSYAAGS